MKQCPFHRSHVLNEAFKIRGRKSVLIPVSRHVSTHCVQAVAVPTRLHGRAWRLWGGRLEVSGEGSILFWEASILTNLWEGCERFWKNCPINFLQHTATVGDIISALMLFSAPCYLLPLLHGINGHRSQWNMLKKTLHIGRMLGCLGGKLAKVGCTHWENIPAKTSGIAIIHHDSTISTLLDPLSHALM